MPVPLTPALNPTRVATVEVLGVSRRGYGWRLRVLDLTVEGAQPATVYSRTEPPRKGETVRATLAYLPHPNKPGEVVRQFVGFLPV
jgi:hypothetical protein